MNNRTHETGPDAAVPGARSEQRLPDAGGSRRSAGRRSALDAAFGGHRAQCGARAQSYRQTIQNVDETSAPFEDLFWRDAIAFVEDSLIAGRGPHIAFDVRRRSGNRTAAQLGLGAGADQSVFKRGARDVEGRHHSRAGDSRRARDPDQRGRRGSRDPAGNSVPGILAACFDTRVGVGAAYRKTIVRQAGGDVRALNRPDGAGAEFIMTVPAEPEAARPAHA